VRNLCISELKTISQKFRGIIYCAHILGRTELAGDPAIDLRRGWLFNTLRPAPSKPSPSHIQ